MVPSLFLSPNFTRGPSITGKIMTSCLGVNNRVIVPFSERKSVKPIMNDSGPFHRVIRQLAITRHILYDQT